MAIQFFFFVATLRRPRLFTCIYDQDSKTADGRQVAKLWFISWFPNNSSTHHKMAYTSAKGKFREALIDVFDTQAASTEELDSNLELAKEDEDDDKDFDFQLIISLPLVRNIFVWILLRPSVLFHIGMLQTNFEYGWNHYDYILLKILQLN